MSQKKINYLARTFDDYKSELVKFTKQYYPELEDSYNDSTIGAWFMDLVASVGDNLSYSIDRAYQENSLNSTNLRSTVCNIARNNGLHIPGPKASMCEVQLSCDLPVAQNAPDWAYAPVVKRSTVVSAGNINFQLSEDVDFGEQFNSDGYSNRTFSPKRGQNGNITAYTVSKMVLAVNGSTRIFKKVILGEELKPFMEVVLPDKNVMNIESVIFKETSNFQDDPEVSEFYIENEMYKMTEEAAYTYRFFETESLADQYVFGTAVNYKEDNEDKLIVDYLNPQMYVDYTEKPEDDSESGNRTTRYYVGEWKAIKQKFITEYTDNGYMKIIFGGGVEYDTMPTFKDEDEDTHKFAKRQMSNLINNDMLGVLPKAGWTMFVLYRVGGGISSNIAVGALNTITLSVAEFKKPAATDGSTTDASVTRGSVLNSLKVTNLSPALAGKDAPSTEELKYLVKYNNSSQGRCVTVKDYKLKLMTMPSKYGAPFRAAVIEENNKIAMSMLGLDINGKLTKALPETLVDNIEEYMSHFKTIGDYIEGKSGKIYNVGFAISLFINKTYDAPTVITNVIEKIKEYMSVNNHDMGENIFIGDLQKEITMVDGVIAIIDFSAYSLYNGMYSSDKCPFPEANLTGNCATGEVETFSVPEGAESFKIDLDAIDQVLYSDYNSMFEVYNPENDIQIKCKLI